MTSRYRRQLPGWPAALLVLALAASPASAQITFPITFEDGSVDYELTDFGGNESKLVADPTDATNTVVESVRTASAECFAGTTVAETSGFDSRIPFAQGATTLSVRVWSPQAGVRVLLKVEEVGKPEVNVETFVFTTVASDWETLVFDFGDPKPNRNPITFGANYNKASIFFDFTCGFPEDSAAEARTYYWDDVEFGGEAAGGGTGGGTGSAISLPITFEAEIDYELTDFGGNASQLVADPADATNTVVESIRTAGAAAFAGTTVGESSGFGAIPFAQGATTMTVRVWTPTAGTPVRLKVEKVGEPGVSVETEVTSATGGAWETLTFDFADQLAGTPALDFNATYNKASIFFNFGETGAASATTYYWDDVVFVGGSTGGGPGTGGTIALPVTFEAEIDYELTDFGGNESKLVADPTDAANTVVESIRTAGAAAFAGTTVGETTGFTEPIPFAEGITRMSLRVWTPRAGTPVRLKVEKVGDPTVSVEAEVKSTVAGMWETLVFDFANQLAGTAAINFNSEYTKASVFFNFGEENAASPTTYYWDDLTFIESPVASEDGADGPQARVAQNAPNPFRAQTSIGFTLPTADHVQVEVYNALGQRVATLADGPMPAGEHALTFDASGLASGTYFYRLRVGDQTTTRSMVVAR